MLAGICLCIMMVICNISVAKIVLQSSKNLQRLNKNLISNLDNDAKVDHTRSQQNFKLNKSPRTESKSIYFVPREEMKFINMCNWLTAIFVITWGTQMVSDNYIYVVLVSKTRQRLTN